MPVFKHQLRQKPIARYQDYCRALFRAARAGGAHVTRIGYSRGVPALPLYAVSSSPRASRAIGIAAGVHGDEKSGPIALLALVRQLKRIRHVRLLLFPVVNPYGFERGQRRSAGRVDLNRHAADPRPPQEARAILASLRRYSLAAFLSLHEDDVLARPYLHGYAHDERGTGIVTSIANTINRSHPLARNRRIHGLRNERGVILSPSRDGSFEDALHRSGAPVSICFEVPDRMPFARMIQTNIDAINALLAVVSPLSP